MAKEFAEFRAWEYLKQLEAKDLRDTVMLACSTIAYRNQGLQRYYQVEALSKKQ